MDDARIVHQTWPGPAGNSDHAGQALAYGSHLFPEAGVGLFAN